MMINRYIRHLSNALTTCALILSGALLLSKPAQAQEAQPTVVELFTSQGCSSCPPADAFLGDLVKRKNVIALTFPVDYWDYLGWKDTLASPAFTKRQKAYARSRGDRQVYTPQMVLNGRHHAVGSYRRVVLGKINELSKTENRIHVPVKLTATQDTVTVTTSTPSSELKTKQATLWLVMFKKKATVKIGRGENTGRKISYHNVVRQMLPVGKWSGGNMKVALPKSELMAQGYDGCVALLQENGGGRIIGAAQIPDLKTAAK